MLSNTSKYQDTIKIGHMIDGSSITQRVREAIVEKVNDDVIAASASQFGLIFCTYERSGALNDEVSEQEIARRLIEAGVGVVVGPASSAAAVSALATAKSQALFISSSATADQLDSQPYFWRTVPPNQLQVEQLKNYLREHNTDRPLTVYYLDSDPYAESIALALIEDDSLQIKRRAFADTVRANDVADASTLLLLSPTQNEVIEFLTQSAQNKTDYEILLTDSGANTAVFNAVRERLQDPARFERLLRRVRGTRPALRPKALPFDVSRLLAGQRYEDVYYAFSFDAAWLAFHAAAYTAGLTDARSRVERAQAALLSLTVDCNPSETTQINAWAEIHSQTRQNHCLRGYTGVLNFLGHPRGNDQRASLDDDDLDGGGLDQTTEAVQAMSQTGNFHTPGNYEMWCPTLDHDVIMLQSQCD